MSSLSVQRVFPSELASLGSVRMVLIFLALGISLSGCGGGPEGPPRVPVAGTVTLDGQALANAEVSLYADGEARVATTDKDGFYQITGGAQVLKYTVVVSKFEGSGTVMLDAAAGMDAGQIEAMKMADGSGKTASKIAKQLVPEKYSSREKSELSVVIPLEGTQTADFALVSK